MEKEKTIKIFLGSSYLLIVLVFLWFFFTYFSIEDISSYEIIKSNRDSLNALKDNNIILTSFLFFLGTVIWVLLLGFAAPIILIGGFIFGKWLGIFLVTLGLSVGATLLYIFTNFFLKEIIKKKFSSKFNNLNNKFKKNEFIFFLIYRFVGGIPFFISNILPALFNIRIKNFFIGSLIGMTPQLFVGVCLGDGLNKIFDDNNEPPSFLNLLFTPDIYLPIMGLIILVLIGIILRKFFYK
tara:strand:+ start:52 stop:768 length:717 start_codon:yes stop_codon:yes gene_type:complete